MPTPASLKWKPIFVEALRHMPVVRAACDAAGVERSTAYRARDTDEDFAKAWDAAMEDGIDKAEQEAYRRAVEGWHEPVIDKGRLAWAYERVVDEDGHEQYKPVLDANGQPVPLTVRKHSDAMLSLVLKGRRKAVFAERTEVTGADGGPVNMDSSARAARVAQLMALANARKSDNSDLA